MAVNATRTDEQVQTVSKRKTLARMFYYLLAYKKQVVAVLTGALCLYQLPSH